MHTHINIQYLGISCDHLGNVRAVVGDRKLWMSSSPGEYRAQVWSVSNYYPFGMVQTGRNWNDASGDYRYGYNGKEEDNEIKANSTENGKSLDYGARWYDPRKARWDATDAVESKYPYLTPYHFAGNNPIQYVDYDGKDFGTTIDHTSKTKTITITASFFAKNPKYNDIIDANIKHVMDQNDKFQYVTAEGVVYDIKFDVTKTPTVLNAAGENVRSDKMTVKEKYVSNEVTVGNLAEFNAIQTFLKNEVAAGYTNRDMIVLSPSPLVAGVSNYVISHEFAHALGHSGHGGGLATYVPSIQGENRDFGLAGSFVIYNTETIAAILGRAVGATRSHGGDFFHKSGVIGTYSVGREDVKINAGAGINQFLWEVNANKDYPYLKTNDPQERNDDFFSKFRDGEVRKKEKK